MTPIVVILVLVVVLLIMMLIIVKHYHTETERLAHMLPMAEEKIMKTLIMIDYEGDEMSRITNNLKMKINKISKIQMEREREELKKRIEARKMRSTNRSHNIQDYSTIPINIVKDV